MDCRILTVNKDHRGCVLLDCGNPVASCHSVEHALELVRTLAEAHRLRAGPPLVVELRQYGRPARRVLLD